MILLKNYTYINNINEIFRIIINDLTNIINTNNCSLNNSLM